MTAEGCNIAMKDFGGIAISHAFTAWQHTEYG